MTFHLSMSRRGVALIVDCPQRYLVQWVTSFLAEGWTITVTAAADATEATAVAS